MEPLAHSMVLVAALELVPEPPSEPQAVSASAPAIMTAARPLVRERDTRSAEVRDSFLTPPTLGSAVDALGGRR